MSQSKKWMQWPRPENYNPDDDLNTDMEFDLRKQTSKSKDGDVPKISRRQTNGDFSSESDAE